MNPIETLTSGEFEQLVQRAVALRDAPPALVRSAIGLWPAAPATCLAATAHTAFRKVLAVLSFDSWASGPLAPGMRAAASQTHHLLFSAQGRDVDLRVTKDSDCYALAGQILGPDGSGSVELVAESDSDAVQAFTAALDDFGEFRVLGVNPGRYVLTLRMSGEEIVLPPIKVGEPLG